jgi:hypothetical protein
LLALDGAETRLRLFQMDLLDPASIKPAVEGARGVFHLASPVILQAEDTEANFLFSVKSTSRVVLIHCCMLNLESAAIRKSCWNLR